MPLGKPTLLSETGFSCTWGERKVKHLCSPLPPTKPAGPLHTEPVGLERESKSTGWSGLCVLAFVDIFAVMTSCLFEAAKSLFRLPFPSPDFLASHRCWEQIRFLTVNPWDVEMDTSRMSLDCQIVGAEGLRALAWSTEESYKVVFCHPHQSG